MSQFLAGQRFQCHLPPAMACWAQAWPVMGVAFCTFSSHFFPFKTRRQEDSEVYTCLCAPWYLSLTCHGQCLQIEELCIAMPNSTKPGVDMPAMAEELRA